MPRPSTYILVVGLLLLGAFGPLQAQEIMDIDKARADLVTLQFNDGRNTVPSFIYSMLDQKTTCYGNDAIYVQVDVDKEGNTVGVRTLTGSNTCYRQSIVDIVKMIKWDASGLSTNKTIFFELKPALQSAPGRTNQYRKVLRPGEEPVVEETPPTDTPSTTDQPVDTLKVTEPIADASNNETETETETDNENGRGYQQVPIEGDENEGPPSDPYRDPNGDIRGNENSSGNQTNEEPEQPDPPANNTEETNTNPTSGNEDNNSYQNDDDDFFGTGNSNNTAPTNQTRPANNTASSTERSPDPSHANSFVNTAGPRIPVPQPVGGATQQAVQVKDDLRDAGVCGLVHVLAELTLVNNNGNVAITEVRILQANSQELMQKLPGILQGLEYDPSTVYRKQYVYFELKTNVRCEGDTNPVVLEEVKPYLEGN